jgi:ABC-type multidrug transport system ATPase subunit
MTRYDIHGETLINDVRASTRQSLSMISLVAQDDDGLLPYLTVRETLRFAACLRLPDLSTAAKSQRAEDILLRMGLKDCANTLIGDELIKGISGGEKRRVSIAIQLLTDPQVLLLDEPTSGLDSFTAQSILQLLTEITEEGRTVILTIHQNQSDLFATNILLLARGGRVVYSGPGNEMLPYFRESGYECSERTNPGDFVLDIITVDLRHADKEAETKKRVDTLISKWTSISQTSSITSEEKAVTGEVLRLPDENELFQKSTASFTTAFPILIRRSALNLWRERNAMIARIMNVVPYGILIALFFAPLRTNYQAIFTRLGMTQLYCFMYFMGTLNNTAAYPLEKKVMYQEVTERAYTISPFFVSYSVLELPFTITAALLTAVVSAFPLGICSTEVFFALFFDIFALISCGESLALALNSFVSDSGLTLSITNTVICVAQTMAGILSIDMPEPLKVVNYISPIKYVAANLAPYLLRGVSFDCVPDEETSDRNCARTQGDDILKLYSLNHNPRIQLAALGAVVVGYRLFAFLALYLRKHSWSQ